MFNSFVIGSLNVHCWVDVEDSSNVERIEEFYKLNPVHVLALQEVYAAIEMESFAGSLSMNFEFCDSYNFGVGLLSKFPIISRKKVTLSDERPLLICELEPSKNSQSFFVCVTHLDHISEETRLQQMEEIQENIRQIIPDNKSHILVGDLNSLYKNDYSQSKWDEINNIREEGLWESAKTQLTSYLFNGGKKNWFKYQDSLHFSDGNQMLSTCRFDTRIDYILLHNPKDSEQTMQFIPKTYLNFPNNFTDHSAIQVGVSLASKE